MALSAKNRSEIVGLIGYEADFERSGISGRIVRDAKATPRQGELNDDTYGLLLRQIGRGLVQYVVFSYTTPIAWVYTNGSVCLPEINYSATTSSHQKMVREAFGGLVNHNLLPEPRSEQVDPLAQYSDMAEADLIELAADLAEQVAESPQTVVRLTHVVLALKARHEATAPARRRVGLYLRHASILQAQYEKDMASGSDYARRNAKAPAENIDSLRGEEWTKAGELRLSDLQKLVPTEVFDGKKLFMATQADRLEQWKNHPDYAALPEKQKALLPCIAAQHISSGYRGWTHDSDSQNRYECYSNIHQSTMNSLLKKKHIVGSRTRPGMAVHNTSYLVLKSPSES